MELLFLGQLGIHRQRERLAGRRLRDGEVAGLVAQRGEAVLKVERDRVIDLGPDLAGGQILPQAVADGRRDADDILIVDMMIFRPLDRERHDLVESAGTEEGAVERGRLAAAFGPVVEVAELDPEHGGLERRRASS